MTLAGVQALAHNLIHKKCAEAPAGEKGLLETAGHRCRKRAFGHKTATCLVFAQQQKRYRNQGASPQSPSLHTILSTKYVQKIGAPRHCMKQMFDMRRCSQNHPLPAFCAN
ncbi:MAG: hypothetical protein H7335_02935 [Massilia sp.]|nr:hypothetical protein [Massilia sp.]